MQELVHLFPTSYFIIFLFIYYLNNHINYSKREIIWLLLFLYYGWSIFLGLRNIYEDVNLDPNIFYVQAKNLSIEELWTVNFPKIDILLQMIMKLYFVMTHDDTIVLILTQSTIISLIFIGVLLLSNFSPNALLLTISLIVFTNTGILMTGNFLRQGLALAIFLNVIYTSKSIFENRKIMKPNIYNRPHFLILAIFQFFAHMSSLYLLICLFFVNNFNIKKILHPSFLFSLLLLVFINFILGQSLFKNYLEIYSGYASIVNDEGIAKLTYKTIIDFILIGIIMILSNFFIQPHNIFFEVLIKICFILLLGCLFYSYAPIIALRLEYYLNFLIIITLGCLLSRKNRAKLVVKITTLGAIVLMYLYSFAVYAHPSITRVLVF